MKRPKGSDPKSVRHTLTFNSYTFRQSKEIADRIGFSFAEYIRHLMVEDIRRRESDPPPPLTSAEQSELKRLLLDIRHGKIRSVRNIEDIVGRLLD